MRSSPRMMWSIQITYLLNLTNHRSEATVKSSEELSSNPGNLWGCGATADPALQPVGLIVWFHVFADVIMPGFSCV